MPPSPEPMKRHSRKAKHLLRVIHRSKHAAVQDMAVHELTHEIDRRHGRSTTPSAHTPGPSGVWRPLTHQAKRLISQLRNTKVWRLQKQLIRELAAELRNGRRRIDQIRERAERAAEIARRGAALTGRGARAVGRGARATGRGARTTWRTGRRAAAYTVYHGKRAYLAVRGKRARSRSWRKVSGRPGFPARPRAVPAAIPRYGRAAAPARARAPRMRIARPRTRTR